MSADLSSRALEPPPQGVARKYPLLSIASVALYFCWPVVIYGCLLYLRNLEAIQYTLLGATTVLWFASCVWVSVLLFRAAIALWPMRPIVTAMGWLPGWPLLIIAGIWLQVSIMAPAWFAPYFRWIDFYLGIPGTMLWLGACCDLYDALFNLLEARWPAARVLREIVTGILRSLLYHHHSS